LSKVKEEKGVTETPLMKQYNQIKARHPEALLLFRVGDFYETFGEDAIKASQILGIILTKRGAGSSSEIELAGFPHHSIDNYLPKLVRAGQRVAICDQLEDPKLTKTIVKRGVTELVTPGVALNDQVLDQKKNNFLCALHLDKELHGIAFLDISTGEFLISQGNQNQIEKLIQSYNPAEIIYQKNKQQQFKEIFGDQFHNFRLDDWVFTYDFASETLNRHFETNSMKGFGVESFTQGLIAAGSALHYLSENQQNRIGHITQLSRIEEDRYVWLDRFTIRNLELVNSQHENATTLSDILDASLTPMGSRLMKRWILMPLKDEKPIQKRLEAVRYLKEIENFEVGERLKKIGDLERLISKVAVGKVNPKEVIQLKRTLEQIDPIKNLLKTNKKNYISDLITLLNPCDKLISKITATLEDEPAIQIGKGNIIRNGVHNELDELRSIATSGKDFLEKLQNDEAEKTGIPSLKVAFNNVFGYYIEVRNTHKDKVPQEWIRKQTLVNAERYITEELKVYESKILGAEERIAAIESQIFQELIVEMSDFIVPIQKNAQLIAQLDCLMSFAVIAERNQYNEPIINNSHTIRIKKGRHPVIEHQLKAGDSYISNDVYLDNSHQQIMMITGPNMSGKSAILRQTALICLMAQMGSFVPAEAADIGIVDKVFTRVGATDNISSGESTFMVEMNETASILNNLSDRSLILLDEIGRGTSTYDGISIAWAIAEYLHEHPKFKAKTLFATHYHELNEMTKSFGRIKNFNVSVREMGSKILFLRKLEEGGSEHSFGIHVAKLAGMPGQVLQRAEGILKQLEAAHIKGEASGKSAKVKKKNDLDNVQLSFFQLDDPVLLNIREQLEAIDINALTPVEALMKLNEIKKLSGI
jgi:DNA mismatch repair protein MutS